MQCGFAETVRPDGFPETSFLPSASKQKCSNELPEYEIAQKETARKADIHRAKKREFAQ
jgi:hypothetical protein